jgi:hypothetical protein
MTDDYNNRAALWTRAEFRPLGHLCWPRFTRYKVARPKRFAVGLNRYPFSVIGVGLVIGTRCYSLRWATPARYTPKVQAQQPYRPADD